MIFRFIFLTCFLAISSCGSDEPEKRYIKEAPVDKEWNELKSIVKNRCQRCHASSEFISSGRAYKNQAAGNRVATGSMPPPGSGEAASITAGEKTKLINYK